MIHFKFERYVAYKGSNVEWLGDVPEHWNISRIKEKGSVKARVGWKALKASEYVDDGFAFLSTPNIKNKDIDFENVNCITYERYVESPEIMLKEDDILLVKDGSTLGIVNIVTCLPRDTTVNSSIGVLRFDSTVFNKYLFYQIVSKYIQDKIQLKKGGMGVPHLFQQDINNIFILIPPLPEQQSIAAYLDNKTTLIDRKIDLLNQKATQYSQLKQSLINETVTSGLDKTVTMKDSGVEWIGEVPTHWDVMRGKDVFVQTKNKAGLESSSYDVLSLTLKGVIKRDLENMKGKIPASFDGYQIANPDNLVLCLFDMDVTPRIVGYVDHLGIITSAYTVIRGKYDTHLKYFYYYYLEQNRNGSLLANSKTLRSTMTFDLFSQLRLPVPPSSEQKEIANYLNEKTAQIDCIVEMINTQIEKLQELRKTLINDVVTGKIKVVKEGQAA